MRYDDGPKTYGGDVRLHRNRFGEPIATISPVLDPDTILARVFLASVERIEVL